MVCCCCVHAGADLSDPDYFPVVANYHSDGANSWAKQFARASSGAVARLSSLSGHDQVTRRSHLSHVSREVGQGRAARLVKMRHVCP